MKHTCAILLGLSLLWTATLRAGDTITNYACDFENVEQNMNWHFPAHSDNKHHWTIGEAVNNGGRRALYVTLNDKDTINYVNSSDRVCLYGHHAAEEQ